jgi:Na+-driven multidrug efflux pump
MGDTAGNTAEINASVKQRVMFAVAAAIMLALWGWSLVPPIENWGNPNEDGFSYVAVFYATPTCLPAGLLLLVGAIAGHGRYVSRARVALYAAAGMTVLVLAFLIIQHIANTNQGKLFGVQIGFQCGYQGYCHRRTRSGDFDSVGWGSADWSA